LRRFNAQVHRLFAVTNHKEYQSYTEESAASLDALLEQHGPRPACWKV